MTMFMSQQFIGISCVIKFTGRDLVQPGKPSLWHQPNASEHYSKHQSDLQTNLWIPQ